MTATSQIASTPRQPTPPLEGVGEDKGHLFSAESAEGLMAKKSENRRIELVDLTRTSFSRMG